ncbi:peptide-methionine (S)-S-oxide reductase [Brevundimonas sp. PAMC22021]|uniref:peptide-methionine (S)-S-oxide reductase n=1 Tax=Brevundimonas sp. PAMC22021 TaxID=2861285 RepID=UPI001C62EA48|nr:peptide-methionine (S)-S-oxide reductase [Brevundimonas sp. PAMC22021]QYF87552.1 peptide-methionine (S)-S-oxide reductase [Brevundimonas sp. PAMC22021]
MTTLQQLGLGGGCHWCTEAVFQSLAGVHRVQQGFIASDAPNDSFSEAVLVDWDAQRLPLDALIEVHLRTHASASRHKMRGKYRSAIYAMDAAQAEACVAALDRLQPGFDAPLITQVLPFRAFQASDARFRNYYATDPDRPFCRTYIEPKLAMLRRRFGTNSVTPSASSADETARAG